MQVLGMCVTLGAMLALGHALPFNSSLAKHRSLCDYLYQHSLHVVGAFVPQCDVNGNFLPQQCHGSTGYCWCVDVITGEEIPNTRTPPGTLRADCGRELSCPYGWARFGKRCFSFIDSYKPWAEAESYCLFEGGNLASVHSYEEHHFIQLLTRADTHDFPRCWLGGHDAIYSSFWMWSDGSKFHYENWGDHVDLSNPRNCLQMNDGYERRWNYGSCSESLPFVCARRI